MDVQAWPILGASNAPPGAARVRPWLGQTPTPAVAIAPHTVRVSRR